MASHLLSAELKIILFSAYLQYRGGSVANEYSENRKKRCFRGGNGPQSASEMLIGRGFFPFLGAFCLCDTMNLFL